MNLADPSTPFFSYVSHKGETLVCLIGAPAAGLVPFQAFRRDLDTPVHGVWNPKERTLALHGDDGFVETDAVIRVGRYVVIEKDGSLTVEADGERHLEERELLVTPSFLDTIRPGRRHAAFLEWTDDGDSDEGHIEALIARDDAELGRPFSTL